MFLLIINEKMKGIYAKSIGHKNTQIADDTTLILDGSKDSLVATLNVLEIIDSISGLQINTKNRKKTSDWKKDILVTKFRLGSHLFHSLRSYFFSKSRYYC